MVGCLIIHGYTGGPYEVEPLKKYLAKRTNWEVIVPTLPGHGRKLSLEKIPYRKWLKEAERNIQMLIKNHQKIYVIGFSMGGMIASYLAAKYEEISKLVLLAPASKYVSLKRWSLNIVGFMKDFLVGNIKENHLYRRYHRKSGMVPISANFQFMRLVRYVKKYLKDVHTPVLMIHGEKDDVVPLQATKYLYRKMASKEKASILFSDSDHQICLGKDQAILNKLVYEFFIRE